jgi:colanic acid/amylovoran biosynthesis glycosyltransferase
LTNEVQLLGAQSQAQVAQRMASAHCYVQPSVMTPTGKMEGIPVALMEALASGLPVVATDLSGIPELVRPKETGYLVPGRDAQALCDALIDVRDSWDSAKQMAEKGRELVIKEFQLHQNVLQLADLFTNVCEGKRD